MGVGNYLSTKSELDFQKKEREAWEIDHVPEGEREEIREIYARKGFEGDDLDRAVEVITGDREVWIDTMMVEELGIIEEHESPITAGVATYIAFIGAGLISLLSYLLAGVLNIPETRLFLFAVVLTAVTIFAVGSARSMIIKALVRRGVGDAADGRADHRRLLLHRPHPQQPRRSHVARTNNLRLMPNDG